MLAARLFGAVVRASVSTGARHVPRIGAGHIGREAVGGVSGALWVTARGKSKSGSMRGVKKENLPVKTCVVCNRPFTWRKKWERCWDEVTTCSKSCNAARRREKRGGGAASGSEDEDDDEDDGNRGRARGGAGSDASDGEGDERDARRAARKAAKKAVKAAKRAKRPGAEGSGDESVPDGSKPCDGCQRASDLLIRCQTDTTGRWRMLCGKCWRGASGGVPDGDVDHPHYRYGGLWKNRRAARHVSTAVPELEKLNLA